MSGVESEWFLSMPKYFGHTQTTAKPSQIKLFIHAQGMGLNGSEVMG